MQLKLIRHLWGIDDPWEKAFPRIKAAGYVGIETAAPPPEDESRFRDLLARHGFDFIAYVPTTGNTVQEHVDSFAAGVERAKTFGPLFISCHGGRDAWNPDQAHAFFAAALEAERNLGIAVAHETHRGRILYNPWITRDMLVAFPELQLCCDLSHWVCVAERLLTQEGDILDLAARRCLHVHARVGYEEGPQVTDPRLPEWDRHVAAHEAWWDAIWDAQAARGFAVSTLTPEFGPPLYQHTLPPNGAPIGDLWDICNWQARRQAQRFQWRMG